MICRGGSISSRPYKSSDAPTKSICSSGTVGATAKTAPRNYLEPLLQISSAVVRVGGRRETKPSRRATGVELWQRPGQGGARWECCVKLYNLNQIGWYHANLINYKFMRQVQFIHFFMPPSMSLFVLISCIQGPKKS